VIERRALRRNTSHASSGGIECPCAIPQYGLLEKPARPGGSDFGRSARPEQLGLKMEGAAGTASPDGAATFFELLETPRQKLGSVRIDQFHH